MRFALSDAEKNEGGKIIVFFLALFFIQDIFSSDGIWLLKAWYCLI